MKCIPQSTLLRFSMAVVAAFTISFSIASMASISGLLPQAKVDPKAPSFITPLAQHLQAAARTAAESATADAPAEAASVAPDADNGH